MYGVWCVRNGTGVCGYKAIWATNKDGEILKLETFTEAEELATRYTAQLHEKNRSVINYEPRSLD